MGKLLVASPALNQTPMSEAVVLVLQDSEDGIFGARLNAVASSQQVTEFEKLSHLCYQRDSLVIGGPLAGPVMAFHQNQSIAEIEIRDGVFMSCSQDALQLLVDGEIDETFRNGRYQYAAAELNYRIVLGVAGWQSRQLHREIEAGLWLPIEGAADIVFAPPETMWFTAIQQFGDDMLHQVTGYNPSGFDCELN